MEDGGSRGESGTELPFRVKLPSLGIAFLAAPLAGTLAASAASMALAVILVVLSAAWPDRPWRQDLHYQGLWDTGWSIIGVGLMTAHAVARGGAGVRGADRGHAVWRRRTPRQQRLRVRASSRTGQRYGPSLLSFGGYHCNACHRVDLLAMWARGSRLGPKKVESGVTTA
jgi:hypothetical protein